MGTLVREIFVFQPKNTQKSNMQKIRRTSICACFHELRLAAASPYRIIVNVPLLFLAHQLQLSVIELWWKVQKFREGAVLMPTKRMTSSKNQKHQRTKASQPKSKAPITTSRKEMRRGGDRHKAQTPRQSGRHKSRKGQQTHVVRKALERG
jgi:hypothetical protein